MGSLSSTPRVQASAPQVVFVPQNQTSVSQTAAINADTLAQENPAEESASQTRSENLLRRNRGRLGTVRTGLSGVLQPEAQNVRKTLLGE